MPNPEFGVHITNEVSNQCFQILSLWVWALFVCLFVCLHISVMPIRCPGIGVTANCHQCRREQGADCTEWSGFLLGCITLPLLLHYLSGCSGTSGTSGSIWSFRYYIKFEWGCFFFFLSEQIEKCFLLLLFFFLWQLPEAAASVIKRMWMCCTQQDCELVHWILPVRDMMVQVLLVLSCVYVYAYTYICVCTVRINADM